jgi:1-pyrroline-5-carboxylate dehydrogenase
MLRRGFLVSSSVRSFSANARYELPPCAGEPFKHYPPGSPDALSLKAELNRAKSEVVEIPCIVNGKEYFTGDIQEQV